MEILNNTQIRTKIVLLVGVLLFSIIVGSVKVYTQLSVFSNTTEKMYNEEFSGYKEATEIQILFEQQFGLISSAPATMDLQILENIRDTYEINNMILEAKLEEFSKNFEKNEYAQGKISAIIGFADKLNEVSAKIIEDVSIFAQEEAGKTLESKFTPLTRQLSAEIISLESYFDEEASHAVEEALSSSRNFLFYFFVSITVLVVAYSVISTAVTVNFSGRVKALIAQIKEIANGKLQTTVDAVNAKDEIGTIAKSIEYFREELVKAEKLKEEQEEFREKAEKEQKLSLNNMASQIEENLATSSNDVSNYAVNVIQSADKLSESSNAVNSYVTEVNDLSETSLMDIQSVSAAVEELSVSNNEIVGQLNKINEVITQTVDNNSQTQETVNDLVSSIESINKFTTFISDIAENTNLLALNATIESARAGEAGKGFAVVANEVKGLASQTAKLTEEISSQLQALTDKMSNAQGATNAIGENVNEINSLSSEITESIKAQSEATAEIAGRIVTTTDATKSIVQKIGNVKNETNVTSENSKQITEVIAEMQNKITHMTISLNKTLRTATPEVNRRDDERFKTNASCKVFQGNKSFDSKLIDVTTQGVGIEIPEGCDLQKDHIKIEIAGYAGQLSANCVESKNGRASLVFDFPDKKSEELFEDFVIDLAQNASTKQPELKAA